MCRHLFLRWALINVLATILGISLASSFVSRTSGAPLLVAGLILLLTVAVALYAGLLSWRADRALSASARSNSDAVAGLLHDAEHVYFAVGVCQLLGLIGAAVGFYLISVTDTSAASEAVHRIIAGLGAGLLATITGVLCSLLLALEYHLLVHALRKIGNQ